MPRMRASFFFRSWSLVASLARYPRLRLLRARVRDRAATRLPTVPLRHPDLHLNVASTRNQSRVLSSNYNVRSG